MTDFIEGNFLTEQVESIKKMAEYITMLKRCGPGLGEFQFDKLTLSDWFCFVLSALKAE